MERIKLVLCVYCWFWFSQINTIQSVMAKEKSESLSYVFTKGDFIIGGLSPVHFSPTADEEQQNPNSFTCQGRLNTRGFEAVEAMLFTMDMLNEGPLKNLVLPNITIGMDIKDTCGSADYAVRESLNFSFIRNAHAPAGHCSGGTNLSQKKTQTIAVVGAAYSGVSMAVTNLCGLFYVPVVSYASTSSLLSNKVRFRYFFRTVPNDMLQAKVMADLVRAMKWNYVIALASDTEYGRSGIEAFKLALASFGNSYDVCIPVDERFTQRSTDEHFERIFKQMKANPKARVVIMFAQLHDANILMGKFRRHQDMANEKYVWVGSDAWADSMQVLKGNEKVLEGRLLGVVPEVVHIEEFDTYFKSFNDNRRKRNPWMREYEYLKVAHNPVFFRQTFKHYPKAHFVMDAVLAVAYALHDTLGCEPHKDCSSKITENLKQQNFRNYLQDVRFAGKSRKEFSFDKLGDAIGVYDIKRLALLDGGNYDFVKVGKWGSKICDVFGANTSLSSCLDMDLDVLETMHKNLENLTEKGVPFSTCSKACLPGYHKNPEKNHAKCCWQCRPCSGNTVTNKTNMDDCIPCRRGYWTNQNHSRCEPIQPTTLSWNDTLGVIIISFSGVGILAVLFTFVVYYIYRETPVVKASSKELCYILLFGIAWCYLTPLLFLADRNDQICRAIPFVVGTCPSLIAGTLLTKTNRISRIFNRKLLKTGTPSCLSKKWQLLMVICLAVVECLIGGGCVFFSETGSKLLISDTKKEVLKQCIGLPDICTAIFWVYNAGLAITCTYQAFRTRKLPENYNEAKFITFTIVITGIVVIIFIPTYIGTEGIYRTTILCFVFIIAGSVTLSCMFVPKLYIILWRPEKNVPMRPRSSTIRLGTISPSASFVRRLSVDSNAEKVVFEGRKNRINSMPAMELVNSSVDGEAREKFKKTKRSFSLSPDMLSRYRGGPECSPERGRPVLPGRRRGSLPGFTTAASMEMIEEGNEFDLQVDGGLRTDDDVFTDPSLNEELEDRDDSENCLNTTRKDCEQNFHNNDGLAKGCSNCESSFVSFNELRGNGIPTTCAIDMDDNFADRIRKEPELKTIECLKCGTALSEDECQTMLLWEAFCKHLSQNGRKQKYNIVQSTDLDTTQQDKDRKRKSGFSGIVKSTEGSHGNRQVDINDNRAIKRLRNSSFYNCEWLSLPSLLSSFSDVLIEQNDLTSGTEQLLKKRNKSLRNVKNFNPLKERNTIGTAQTNGRVCHTLQNGVTESEIDKLLSEEDAETVM